MKNNNFKELPMLYTDTSYLKTLEDLQAMQAKEDAKLCKGELEALNYTLDMDDFIASYLED